MSGVATALSVLGALVTLAGIGGAMYANFRGAQYKATLDRVSRERDDYLSRLNFIEPRHRAAEQQLEVLLALHNPKDQLDDMQSTATETLRIVRGIKNIAEQIDRQLYRPRGERDDRSG